MAEFRVAVVVTLTCEVLVEATNAVEARAKVKTMEPPDFLDNVVGEEVDIDEVYKVKPPSAKGKKP